MTPSPAVSNITVSNITIDTLVVTAPSARDAARLAVALPGALARAVEAAFGHAPAQAAERLDAGIMRANADAPGLADRIAARIVATALTPEGKP